MLNRMKYFTKSYSCDRTLHRFYSFSRVKNTNPFFGSVSRCGRYGSSTNCSVSNQSSMSLENDF